MLLLLLLLLLPADQSLEAAGRLRRPAGARWPTRFRRLHNPLWASCAPNAQLADESKHWPPPASEPGGPKLAPLSARVNIIYIVCSISILYIAPPPPPRIVTGPSGGGGGGERFFIRSSRIPFRLILFAPVARTRIPGRSQLAATFGQIALWANNNAFGPPCAPLAPPPSQSLYLHCAPTPSIGGRKTRRVWAPAGHVAAAARTASPGCVVFGRPLACGQRRPAGCVTATSEAGPRPESGSLS